MRDHVSDCSECRRYARGLTDSAEFLRANEIVPSMSPDFTDGVVRGLRRDRFRRQLLVWRPALVGALAASLLLTVFTNLLAVADREHRSSPRGSAIKQLEDEAGRQIFRTPPPTYDDPTRVDV